MPTDRVYHARRLERLWNLESRNTKESGLNTPTHKPGPGHKRRHHAGAAPVTWRYTPCVARHLLRGAAPEQNGCNAHGSGAMPTDRVYHARRQERPRNLESHNTKESGLNTPTHKPGLDRPIKRRHHAGAAPVAWRCTRCVALHPFRGAAPEQNGCNAHGSGACPPIGCNAYGSGAMPTDRVYHAPRQEQARNLESHNTKDSGLNTPAQNPGLGNPSGLSTYGWVNDSNSRAQPCRRGRKERGTRVGQPL